MSFRKPLICVVDDDLNHTRAIAAVLKTQELEVATFPSATEFLAQPEYLENCDLLISDINMPGLSGFDLCRALRATPRPVRLPIILITGSNPSVDQAQGLEAGADEFIGKPFSTRRLLAKIQSLLEIRAHEMATARELESSKGLNAELARFLSPNIADRLCVDNHENFLQPHQTEVSVLFVDLRSFTSFSERARPEEVLEVLRQYYTAVGCAAIKHKGTLGHLAGDGIMIFFNDPEPIPDHSAVAVQMALEARDLLLQQKHLWDEKHYDIDFGMGLSTGTATIGGIGFEQFSQYSVIGTVANRASRLCHLAVEGQILVASPLLSCLQNYDYETSPLGEAKLKGIEKPVAVHNILSLREAKKASA